MKLITSCIKFYWNNRHTYYLYKSKKVLFPSKQYPIYRQYNHRPTFTLSSTSFLGFHTSSVSSAKSHQERENEYAHSIMENSQLYKDTLVKFRRSSERKLPNSSASKELSAFAEVTYKALHQGLTLENKQFTSLIKDVSHALPKVSDEDIISFLHFLCLWAPSPKSFSPNFKSLWNSLDHQCVQRFQSWDLNQRFKVADYWFCLRLNRISQYNRHLILDLLQNLHSLSNSHVVQLMFLVNLQRKVPHEYMKPLEKKLLTIINSATIEEIGVICLGFFKTENKIGDFNIIKAIINRYCKEVDNINSLTANAILKFLKKSMLLSQTDNYIPVLRKSIKFVSCWDIPTTIHLALLSAECHVYDPQILNAVTEKVSNNIEEARIKDCVKLLQCLSHFNHFPERKFNERFFQELNKKSRYGEIDAYPRDLAYSALYYSYLGHFNYKIISTVLEPGFVEFCHSKHSELTTIFAEIDYCVEIECQDYKGPRLPKEKLQILGNRRGNLPQESENASVLMLNITSVLKSLEDLLNGNENILVRHILPHFFSPDIIVRLSKNSESMLSLYGSYSADLILKPPEDETWVCFVVTAPFSFAYKSRQMTGVTSMKLRQLEKIGYQTVLVDYKDWPLSDLMRRRHLKLLLSSFQLSSASKAFVKL